MSSFFFLSLAPPSVHSFIHSPFIHSLRRERRSQEGNGFFVISRSRNISFLFCGAVIITLRNGCSSLSRQWDRLNGRKWAQVSLGSKFPLIIFAWSQHHHRSRFLRSLACCCLHSWFCPRPFSSLSFFSNGSPRLERPLRHFFARSRPIMTAASNEWMINIRREWNAKRLFLRSGETCNYDIRSNKAWSKHWEGPYSKFLF